MTKANEPAFPRTYSHDGHNGLTKREYFAAMAMQGLLPQVGMNSQFQDAYDIAVWSAQAADALIAELAKAEPETETAELRAEIAALEELRPHWAEGHSSDSVAAQVTITALNQIWQLVGATNQTEAVAYIKTLKGGEA